MTEPENSGNWESLWEDLGLTAPESAHSPARPAPAEETAGWVPEVPDAIRVSTPW